MNYSTNRFFRATAWLLVLSMGWLNSCHVAGRSFTARTLHFDLDEANFLHTDEDYWLHVAGQRLPLREHTESTLSDYAANGGSATITPSHFVTTSLPNDRTMLVYITQRSDKNGALAAAHGANTPHGLGIPIIHIPADARLAHLENNPAAFQALQAQSSSEGCTISTTDVALKDVTVDLLNTYTPCDVAKTIIFHHSDLLNFDTTNAATVMNHLETAEGLNELALAIKNAGQHGWYTLEAVNTADGTQFVNSQGEKVFKYLIKDEIRAAATTVLTNTLNATKNDASLNGVTYSVTEGTSAVEQVDGSDVSALTLARQTTTTGTEFKISSEGPQPGFEVTVTNIDNQDVTIELTNKFIRHLTAYIEFYDASDTLITPPNWTSFLSNSFDSSDRDRLETDTLKFLSLISPPSTFMSIPVDPRQEDLTFTMPSNATYAKIYAGGLGLGGTRNSTIEEMGVALTATFELGIPTLMLATAASLPNLGSALRTIYTTESIVVDLEKEFFSLVWSTGSKTFGELVGRAAIFLGDILVKAAFQQIITLLAEAIAEEAAEDAIPFAGWIMAAISIASTVSLLAQASVEVASSPWVIENRLNATHDIAVTIDHDTNDFEFPATATHYTVKAQFSKHDTRTTTKDMPGTEVSDPITVDINDVPSGGTVNIIVAFYSDNDVLVGHVEKDDITNLTPDGDSALAVDVAITEELVALDSSSVYEHKQKLTYSGSAHEWTAGSAPSETLADLDASESGNALSELVDIAISQKVGALGYAWRAFSSSINDCDASTETGQLYTYQVISATADPETGLKFSGCGTQGQPYISLELLGAADGTGNNFVLDPNTDGFFYIRKFVLDDSGSFSLGSTSYGRFPVALDSAVLHPKGYILGINQATSKIYSVRLSETAVSDSDAPKATQFSGPALSLAGAAANANLLVNPVAVTLGSNGQLIILETISNLTQGTSDSDTQGRLRAFSEFGHPIKTFSDGADFGVGLTAETDPVTYLDVGIESKGYIYVLSYANDGDAIADYRLDIYNPDGSFLVRTTGASAARMTVDLWRNVYTLNYETIVGPDGRTEPSVSQWIPPVP